MLRSRTLVCVGLAVVALALFGVSATLGQDGIDLANRQNDGTVVRETVQPSDAVSDLSREVARLRQRLQRRPVAQDISRNPFLFITEEGEAESVRSPRRTREIPDAAGEDIVTAWSSRTAFSFIGVALDEGQRTAILLMEDGQVVVVGVGESVATDYRVGAIEEAAITMIDSNGTVRRYELR